MSVAIILTDMSSNVNFFTVLMSLGGFGGLVSILWAMINIKSRKRVEEARADTASAEADMKSAEVWKRYGEVKSGEASLAEEEVTFLNNKMNRFITLIVKLLTASHDSEFHYCEHVTCDKRKPPLGSHDSVSSIIDEINDLQKTEFRGSIPNKDGD